MPDQRFSSLRKLSCNCFMQAQVGTRNTLVLVLWGGLLKVIIQYTRSFFLDLTKQKIWQPWKRTVCGIFADDTHNESMTWHSAVRVPMGLVSAMRECLPFSFNYLYRRIVIFIYTVNIFWKKLWANSGNLDADPLPVFAVPVFFSCSGSGPFQLLRSHQLF